MTIDDDQIPDALIALLAAMELEDVEAINYIANQFDGEDWAAMCCTCLGWFSSSQRALVTEMGRDPDTWLPSFALHLQAQKDTR